MIVKDLRTPGVSSGRAAQDVCELSKAVNAKVGLERAAAERAPVAAAPFHRAAHECGPISHLRRCGEVAGMGSDHKTL